MRIELLTFDGDGTLWDFDAAMRKGIEHAARLLASRLGDVAAPTPAEFILDRNAVGAEHREDGLSMEDLRWRSFERTLSRTPLAGRRDLVDLLYAEFMEIRFSCLALYDDVRPVLSKLARDRTLVLITNGNTGPERVGLDAIFNLVVNAHACGLWKPDPEIYRYAARRANVPPESALHVGDHPNEDVEAARAAGFRTVWLNRADSADEGDCPADACISQLNELPRALQEIERHPRRTAQ